MGKTSLRIGINGMGRIGRTILREWALRRPEGIEIVACNNPGAPDNYVHLLTYDSVHGVYPGTIHLEGNTLRIDGKDLTFFDEKNPSEIPWAERGVETVVDATGIFRDKKALASHLKDSVKKVIMCAPGKDLDATFVMGVNHESYDPKTHHIVSNASCTTNCLAPLAKVLDEGFGIEAALMNTVHAYTLDQMTLDSAHKDKRRARAAGLNMIPTSTGAAAMVGEVIPHLLGKFDGGAVRVPTPDVSLVDLTVHLSGSPSLSSINEAMEEAASSSLKGILAYSDRPLVSQDFRGRRESSIYDAPLTKIVGPLAKLSAWYDNEVGFSNRVIDLAMFMGSKRG
ncbi:MAG: type I glyceraldehyde-3-phosphate dehydrogenase [Bacteriovoracales bacterium]|nr:type I glyceraldehyde-3-phosphate dehydrogenase [Bacteriovoracales bacterium]